MAYDSSRDKSSTPAWQADTSQRLQGKVALVTGMGSGIGQHCGLLFARHGAKVHGCDINFETAQATACQAVWPEMQRRGGGSIINISSANAHQALRGSPTTMRIGMKESGSFLKKRTKKLFLRFARC